MQGGMRTQLRYDSYTKMHEVWDKLDKALDQLKLVQKGHQVETEEAWNIVLFWNGPELKRLEFDWINGVLTNEEFFQYALMYINRFADSHSLKRPEV